VRQQRRAGGGVWQRTEHLTNLSEQSNEPTCCKRLARSQERVVVLPRTGHGEPRLDGRTNFDFSAILAAKLGVKGFRPPAAEIWQWCKTLPDHANVW